MSLIQDDECKALWSRTHSDCRIASAKPSYQVVRVRIHALPLLCHVRKCQSGEGSQTSQGISILSALLELSSLSNRCFFNWKSPEYVEWAMPPWFSGTLLNHSLYGF